MYDIRKIAPFMENSQDAISDGVLRDIGSKMEKGAQKAVQKAREAAPGVAQSLAQGAREAGSELASDIEKGVEKGAELLGKAGVKGAKLAGKAGLGAAKLAGRAGMGAAKKGWEFMKKKVGGSGEKSEDVEFIANQITEDPDVVNELFGFGRKKKEPSQEERRELMKRASEKLGMKYPDVGGKEGTIQKIIDRENAIINNPESTQEQIEAAKRRLKHIELIKSRTQSEDISEIARMINEDPDIMEGWEELGIMDPKLKPKLGGGKGNKQIDCHNCGAPRKYHQDEKRWANFCGQCGHRWGPEEECHKCQGSEE